jgi:hypothetical protein
MQEEGIVVKDVTSPWKMNDRGTAWQKIKPGTVAECFKMHHGGRVNSCISCLVHRHAVAVRDCICRVQQLSVVETSVARFPIADAGPATKASPQCVSQTMKQGNQAITAAHSHQHLLVDYVETPDFDAVIVGVHYGTGRRGGQLAEWTLALALGCRADGKPPTEFITFCRCRPLW